MKSKNEIINEAIRELGQSTGMGFIGFRSAIWNVIDKAMKEQDRNTRHACAEAVLRCAIKGIDGVDSLINQYEAHNRIMNTQEAP